MSLSFLKPLPLLLQEVWILLASGRWHPSPHPARVRVVQRSQHKLKTGPDSFTACRERPKKAPKKTRGPPPFTVWGNKSLKVAEKDALFSGFALDAALPHSPIIVRTWDLLH